MITEDDFRANHGLDRLSYSIQRCQNLASPETKTYQTLLAMQAPAETKDFQNPQRGNIRFGVERNLCLFGASVRSAAESAKRAGYEVYAIDRFGDRDTVAVAKEHLPLPDLTKASEKESAKFRNLVASITNRMSFLVVGGTLATGPLLRSLPLDLASKRLMLAADQLGQWEFLQEACEATCFRLPSSQYFDGKTKVDHSLFELDRGSTSRLLLKQLDHSGGLGVHWYVPSSNHWNPEQLGTRIIQQWVPGRLYGSSLLSNGREVALLGTCRGRFTRLPDRPFVYSGSTGPVDVESSIRQSLLKVAAHLIGRTGFRGVFNLDWIRSEGGKPCLIEVNPRWSGSVELLELSWRNRLAKSNPASNFKSIISWVVDAIAGDSLPPFLENLPTDQLSQTSRDTTSFTEMENGQKSVSDLKLSMPENESASRQRRGWEGQPAPFYHKRIIFSRRDQIFDPDDLPVDLNSSESLHDLPEGPILIPAGQPVCTLITRCSDVGIGQAVHRYRSVVNALSNSPSVD